MDKFRNIGPASEVWLKKIGIETHEDLERIGPNKAYALMVQKGHPENLNMLYSLIGARFDVDWQQVAGDLKETGRS